MWAMPSLEPISVTTSLAGSRSTEKTGFVPVGNGLPELIHAFVAWILVVFGIGHSLIHRFDDVVRGGDVGIADTEVYEVHASGPYFRLLLVDSGEEVRGYFFGS